MVSRTTSAAPRFLLGILNAYSRIVIFWHTPRDGIKDSAEEVVGHFSALMSLLAFRNDRLPRDLIRRGDFHGMTLSMYVGPRCRKGIGKRCHGSCQFWACEWCDTEMGVAKATDMQPSD